VLAINECNYKLEARCLCPQIVRPFDTGIIPLTQLICSLFCSEDGGSSETLCNVYCYLEQLNASPIISPLMILVHSCFTICHCTVLIFYFPHSSNLRYIILSNACLFLLHTHSHSNACKPKHRLRLSSSYLATTVYYNS
jgi:hypothetical protein